MFTLQAQLQSHGIQFYLGMFDTEEEAARAYDRKAREEKGGKNPINFDVNPGESEPFQLRPSSPSYRYYGGGEEDDDAQFQSNQKFGLPPSQIQHQNKRGRNEGDQDPSDHLRRLDYQSTTENMKILWDRHCQIAQRLLLAKAAQSKLAEFQAVAPDTEKETILKALSEEIILLVVVKSQLEEAVSRCFRLGLDLNTSSAPPPAPVSVPPAVAASSGAPGSSTQQQFPIYNQSRSSLPNFGSNFNSNGASVGGRSTAAGGNNMPPYYFPQLPPFPATSNGGSNGNPFAPLRRPYVPTGATGSTGAGSYFGQTLPPSALPSLSLPSSSSSNYGNTNSNNSGMKNATASVASDAASSFASVAGPGDITSESGSFVAPPTHQGAATGGTTMAPADMTAAMSSFQALTKGPSLLGNTNLLSPPALMDNVLIGTGRLPPPPQLPVPSAGFEPPSPFFPAPSAAKHAIPQESVVVAPCAPPSSPGGSISGRSSSAAPGPAPPALPSAAIAATSAEATSEQGSATAQSTAASSTTSAQPKPAAPAAAALKAPHKAVHPQHNGGDAGVRSGIASSHKRSAAAMEEDSSIGAETLGAVAPPRDSPRKSRASSASATGPGASAAVKGATAATGASAFLGSDHALFQLSAEQEKAIISAAVAASKSRKGSAKEKEKEEQQKDIQQQRPVEVKVEKEVEQEGQGPSSSKGRGKEQDREAPPPATAAAAVSSSSSSSRRSSGGTAVTSAAASGSASASNAKDKDKSTESTGRRTSNRR